MNDPFFIREDCNVAWLAFKPQLGILLTPQNEELLRTIFKMGFSEGWGKGSEMAHKKFSQTIDNITGTK